MNISLLFGIAAAGLTLWLGVFKSTSNPSFYFDPHAIILVCGGTFAAAMIGFPFGKLLGFFETLTDWIFRSKTPDYQIVEELYEVAINFRQNRDLVDTAVFSHPFIREGFQFVRSEAFNDRQIQEILTKRIVAYKKALQADAKMLNALAKFPPAFGLLGASTGMIAMMLNLNKGGAQAIGPAMATALVATFWGIALANLVFLPMADFANKIAQDDSHTRLIIMEGLILVKRNEEPHVIVEILRSHLPQADRGKIKVLRTWDAKKPTIKAS